LHQLLTLGWIVLASCAGLGGLFLVDSLREGERRAALVSLLAVLAVLAVGIPPLLLDYPSRGWVVGGMLVLAAIAGLALALPYGRFAAVRIVSPPARVDERDAVFHRFYRLRPDTPAFDAYYAAHPALRTFDDEVRALPHLGAVGSRTHDPLASPYSSVCDEATALLAAAAEGRPPADERVEVAPAELTGRLKGFARLLGADLVGCTELDPAWVYSHVGRGPGEWGAPIELDHPRAIAIAVEMRHRMIRHAPGLATVTETTSRYLEAAKIALGLTRYLQQLGYRARAHVDANYRVMCVPVAADAGLGELGRLGLLMTPEFGPRIRLAVVTTDAPLVLDRPLAFGVQDFCGACLKCADVCPSRSIDRGAPAEHNGVLRWRSERDGCYRYWRLRGSDCGLCVKVCPYAHPRSWSHDLVRSAIQRNPAARRLAIWADDLAYGRRPRGRREPPAWHG
jgi:ferredoxin